MKLFKKRWHRLPVGIITAVLVACLIAGSAFAAILTENQTITQTISDYEYGTITVTEPNLDLSDIKVGGSIPDNFFPDAVIVEVGPDGVDKWLHLTLDATTTDLYDAYLVSLYSPAAQNQMNEIISLQVRFGFPAGFPDILEASVQLTEPGTYIFNEQVQGTAGSASGTADVVVTITLEEEK